MEFAIPPVTRGRNALAAFRRVRHVWGRWIPHARHATVGGYIMCRMGHAETLAVPIISSTTVVHAKRVTHRVERRALAHFQANA